MGLNFFFFFLFLFEQNGEMNGRVERAQVGAKNRQTHTGPSNSFWEKRGGWAEPLIPRRESPERKEEKEFFFFFSFFVFFPPVYVCVRACVAHRSVADISSPTPISSSTLPPPFLSLPFSFVPSLAIYRVCVCVCTVHTHTYTSVLYLIG